MVGSPRTYIQCGFQGFIGIPLVLADRLKGRQGKGLRVSRHSVIDGE